MAFLGQDRVEPLASREAIFAVMGYTTHAEEVRAFHASDAPLRIVTAPARTSKSFSAAADIVARVLQNARASSRTWIVGPDYPTNREFQYVWDWLVTQRERWVGANAAYRVERAQNTPGQGNLLIVLDLGADPAGKRNVAVLEGKSSTNERGLQGEEVSIACLSEAAEHPERIWTKYLASRSSWTIFPTTPKPNAGWLRDMIEAGVSDPSLGIEHFHFPPQANPHYNQERYERERRAAERRSGTGRAEDDPFFAEQFLGLWVAYTGRVVPLDLTRHLVDLEENELQGLRIFASMDYGYQDPSVALFYALRADRQLVVFDEIYERHLTSESLIEKVYAKLENCRDQLDYVTGDPKQPQVETYLRRLGLPVIQISKRMQSDRAVGHRRIVDLLADDPLTEKPRLVFSRRCTKTLAELQQLSYREGAANEYGSTALVGRDDAFDCLRYGVMTLPEPRKEREEKNWLSEYRDRERISARQERRAGRLSRRMGIAS